LLVSGGEGVWPFLGNNNWRVRHEKVVRGFLVWVDVVRGEAQVRLVCRFLLKVVAASTLGVG